MTTNFTTRKANKAFLLSLLLLLVYIIILIFLGHPLPHRDDLIFIGTPIHAVQNGEFINPYCEGFLKQLGTIEHLYYMPGQVYLLFAWLKITGVSSFSILTFQWIGIVIGMYSLYAVCVKKLYFKPIVAIWLSGIYLTILISWGLRPDAWGIGLVFAGLLVVQKLNFKRQFTGIVIGGFGVLCAPLALGILVPLSIYFCLTKIKLNNYGSFLAAGILACGIIIGLLGLMIGFRYAIFFDTLIYHSSLPKNNLNPFVQFFSIITDKYYIWLRLPIFAIGILIGVYCLLNKSSRIRWSAICLLVCTLFSIALYPEKTINVIGQILMFILLCLAVETFKTKNIKRIYLIVIGLLFFIAQLPFFIALVGQRNEQENREVILKETKDFKLVVGDAVVARTIYDYRLPDNFRSLEFHAKDYYPKSIKDCPPDEIWIFSPGYTIILPQNGMTFPPKVTMMGKEFGSIPKNGLMLQVVKHSGYIKTNP